jgi:hypothetical protein
VAINYPRKFCTLRRKEGSDLLSGRDDDFSGGLSFLKHVHCAGYVVQIKLMGDMGRDFAIREPAQKLGEGTAQQLWLVHLI